MSSGGGVVATALQDATAFATAAQGALAATALQSETDPVFAASEAALLVAGDKAKLDSALQDPTAFATAAQGATADTALQPNATADGTYPVYNDGVTSGQLASITIANGLITAVTVLP